MQNRKKVSKQIEKRKTMGEIDVEIRKNIIESISEKKGMEKQSLIIGDPKGELFNSKLEKELINIGYDINLINPIEYNELSFIANIMKENKNLARHFCLCWTRNILLIEYSNADDIEIVRIVSEILYDFIENQINNNLEKNINRNEFKEYLYDYSKLIDDETLIKSLDLVRVRIFSVPLHLDLHFYDDIENFNGEIRNHYKELAYNDGDNPVALFIPFFNNDIDIYECFYNIMVEQILAKMLIDNKSKDNLKDISIFGVRFYKKYSDTLIENISFLEKEIEES